VMSKANRKRAFGRVFLFSFFYRKLVVSVAASEERLPFGQSKNRHDGVDVRGLRPVAKTVEEFSSDGRRGIRKNIRAGAVPHDERRRRRRTAPGVMDATRADPYALTCYPWEQANDCTC